jgi:hypothetical protein
MKHRLLFLAMSIGSTVCAPVNALCQTSPAANLADYATVEPRVQSIFLQIKSLSADRRKSLFRDIQSGKISSAVELLGPKTEDAQWFIERASKVEGNRPGEYPSARRLNLLYEAWVKKENFSDHLLAAWNRPTLPGFSIKWLEDLSHNPGDEAKPGELIVKYWSILNNGKIERPFTAQFEPIFQVPTRLLEKQDHTFWPRHFSPGEEDTLKIVFNLPQTASLGTWNCYFAITVIVDGRRQYLNPQVSFLLDDQKTIEKSLSELLSIKLTIVK